MKKIRLVHILTDVNSKREIASINQLEKVSKFGIEYVPQINKIYDKDDWMDIVPITGNNPKNYRRGHYGAFLSFKKAFLDNFTEDLDALILCECDCGLSVSTEKFFEIVNKSIDFCNKHNIKYFSFGDRYSYGVEQSPLWGLDEDFPEFQITTKIILAHCLIIPNHAREYFKYAFENYSWESPDIWFNEVVWKSGQSSHGIMRIPIAFQHPGESIIDSVWKNKQ